jgi:hypothetical protein
MVLLGSMDRSLFLWGRGILLEEDIKAIKRVFNKYSLEIPTVVRLVFSSCPDITDTIIKS